MTSSRLACSTALLLIAVPSAMINRFWGCRCDSTGLTLHLGPPAYHDLEMPVVLTVHQSGPDVNGRPIAWDLLPSALRSELSRRGNPAVYVGGDGSDLSVADIVRGVDATQTAWYGVPVVLLTPKLKTVMETDRLKTVPR